VTPRESLTKSERAARARYAVWGSELSPFTLKVMALCQHAGLDFRVLPDEGSTLANLRALLRVTALRRGLRRPSYPPLNVLDELPLVPYLLGPAGEIVFDSSAIAEWLDARAEPGRARLVPAAGAERFAVRLIDEYFDELGLYFAHHNRWVVSAATNDAGARLAREFRSLVAAPLRSRFGNRFSARQVRRLPYLLSVAPAEPERYDLARERRPPGRIGFPPTHELLDAGFRRMLEKLEALLRMQPFLVGGSFSVADASAYGQLAMNLRDPTAAALIELRAPATTSWVRRISAGSFPAPTAATGLTAACNRLLEEIGEIFVPLMRQNDAAYEDARSRQVRSFNEPAFDRGEALYDGTLLGRPYRAVAKTFQVKVWRRLLEEWRALTPGERAALPIALE